MDDKIQGAHIVYGPMANPTYDVIIAQDRQEFKLGNITIVALHTPIKICIQEFRTYRA